MECLLMENLVYLLHLRYYTAIDGYIMLFSGYTEDQFSNFNLLQLLGSKDKNNTINASLEAMWISSGQQFIQSILKCVFVIVNSQNLLLNKNVSCNPPDRHRLCPHAHSRPVGPTIVRRPVR